MSRSWSDLVGSQRFTNIIAILILAVVVSQFFIARALILTRREPPAAPVAVTQAASSPTPTVTETVTASPSPLSYEDLPPLEGWPCTMANGMPGRLAVKKNPPENMLSCD